MKIHYLLILPVFFALSACSHFKQLKAPCTYDDRTGCGWVVPLQNPLPSDVAS